MKAKIVKIRSNHDMLSKDEYIGEIDGIPKVGSPFVMIHSMSRMLSTTPIISIHEEILGRRYRLETRNSTYELTINPDDPIEGRVGKFGSMND